MTLETESTITTMIRLLRWIAGSIMPAKRLKPA
jgi:hypothetical protein